MYGQADSSRGKIHLTIDLSWYLANKTHLLPQFLYIQMVSYATNYKPNKIILINTLINQININLYFIYIKYAPHVVGFGFA